MYKEKTKKLTDVRQLRDENLKKYQEEAKE
jgi:hypothetical protein